jgi:hypothetical protein
VRVIPLAPYCAATRRLEPARIRLSDLPPDYWKYLLAVGVFGIGNSSKAFIILKATSIDISTELTVVDAAFNFVAAAVSYPAGDLSDRQGRKRGSRVRSESSSSPT